MEATMRDNFSLAVTGEIMIEYFDDFSRVKLSVTIEIADHFLFLRVHADHGLTIFQIRRFDFHDVFKLRVAIRMLLERLLFLRLTAYKIMFLQ